MKLHSAGVLIEQMDFLSGCKCPAQRGMSGCVFYRIRSCCSSLEPTDVEAMVSITTSISNTMPMFGMPVRILRELTSTSNSAVQAPEQLLS